VAIDLALPSGTPVIELLPAILELVDHRDVASETPRRWRLERPAGQHLEESLSLTDNGVHDGELLILHRDPAPRFGAAWVDPCRRVAAATSSHLDVGERLMPAACVSTAALASAFLIGTAGSSHATTGAIIAAVGALATAVTVIRAGAPGLAAVLLAGAAGFLAVPSGPAAPNVFLAATAAGCSSLLLIRLGGHPSAVMTAAAGLSLPAAAATLVAMPMATAGAVLAATAVGLLTLAPRTAVWAADLATEPRFDVDERTAAGHAVLTGLVAGCAAGAAVGTVVMAIAARTADPVAATAFAAAVGTALVLRARSQADAVRQLALLATGSTCLAAGLAVLCQTRPGYAGPVAGGLILVGLTLGRVPVTGAAVARWLDRVEYVALAAVVPAACWVAGGYAFLSELAGR
jgi:type VII secretion integral membrane protein EccD